MNEVGIKSKERVKEHGEVFTPSETVLDMMNLDGVKEESYKIDSKFLEPSCGTGNFLVEILGRKLSVVPDGADNVDIFHLNTARSLASIYGVDIIPDNVDESRCRMKELVEKNYIKHFGRGLAELPNGDKMDRLVNWVLQKNIILGDTLKSKMKDHKTDYNSKHNNISRIATVPDFGDEVLTFSEFIFEGDECTRVTHTIDRMDDDMEHFEKVYFLDIPDAKGVAIGAPDDGIDPDDI